MPFLNLFRPKPLLLTERILTPAESKAIFGSETRSDREIFDEMGAQAAKAERHWRKMQIHALTLMD